MTQTDPRALLAQHAQHVAPMVAQLEADEGTRRAILESTTKPLPQRSATFPNTSSSAQPLQSFASKLKELQWDPHPLSTTEVDALSNETATTLQLLRQLYTPAASPEKDADRLLRKMEVQDKLNLTYWRIFPINRFPNEILCNIFSFVSWDVSGPSMAVHMRFLLTWVCSHWRNVAFGDGSIWNAVWFRDQPPYDRSFAFIDRAGEQPLDIRINDSIESQLTVEQTEAFMERLAPKLPNTRILIILLHKGEAMDVVVKKLGQVAATGVTMKLERLELHRTGPPYIPPVLGKLAPFLEGASYPRFNYFSTNGIHWDWPKVDLSNLTTIDLRRVPLDASPSMEWFRKTLILSPRLEKLAIDGVMIDGSMLSYDTPPITLPYLHTFLVGHLAPHHTEQLIRTIEAPNLVDLAFLGLAGSDYTSMFAALIGKFPRALLLTLYEISIEPTEACNSAFFGFIRSMPNLEYLRMATINVDVLRMFLLDSENGRPNSHLNAELVKGMALEAFYQDEEPNIITSTDPKDHPPSRPLGPKIRYIEAQHIPPRALLGFMIGRAMAGHRLHRAYLLEKYVVTLAEPARVQMHRLCVGGVAVLISGGRTPEEMKLMKDAKAAFHKLRLSEGGTTHKS